MEDSVEKKKKLEAILSAQQISPEEEHRMLSQKAQLESENNILEEEENIYRDKENKVHSELKKSRNAVSIDKKKKNSYRLFFRYSLN